MNIATCILTFRCDSDLGAVLIAVSRGIQQAAERLNTYQQKIRQFNMVRTGLRMTQPPLSRNVSQVSPFQYQGRPQYP